MLRSEMWYLSPSEQEVYHAAFRFLSERLEEPETMEWALNLGPEEKATRLAICDLLGGRRKKELSAPWRDAWHLIIENWRQPLLEKNRRNVFEIYEIRERLTNCEFTKGIVSELVDLVTPNFKIRMVGRGNRGDRAKIKKPEAKESLISCTLTSGPILDVKKLNLESIKDKDFLFALATALDNLLVSSLDLARRIGWDGEHKYWVIGQMHRVYYQYGSDEYGKNEESDEFSDGIVPAVKLLYEVIAHLSDVDRRSAASFVMRWKPTDSQIHMRLLSALYRNKEIASVNLVEELISQLNENQFWNLQNYPEIAEVRAKRFNDLSKEVQVETIKKIKKGPSRAYLHRAVKSKKIKTVRQYYAVREMKRIFLAGGKISKRDLTWLDDKLFFFPELKAMERVDEDFPDRIKTFFVKPKPDLRFNSVEGEERLRALEIGLNKKRSWLDEEGNASDWISYSTNCLNIISDFETTIDSGQKYPKVWEKFGWSHSSKNPGMDRDNRDLPSEVSRVLNLLKKLNVETISQAINGISHWLSDWRTEVFADSNGIYVWFKVWPLAVTATNASKEKIQFDSNTTGRVVEPPELDTLNTPVGKLINLFFIGLPGLKDGKKPLEPGQPLERMRNEIFSSNGRSLLIAQHRCVESLSYFFQADPNWTETNLIAPLKTEETETVPLWRAISRRLHKHEVLQIVGKEMAARALDQRLKRDCRSMLVKNLIVDCLHSYLSGTKSAVEHSIIQQMLRSVEDEVRSSGAGILKRFVKDLSKSSEENKPEDLYFKAVKPFLRAVWPQEKSLATPGVSQALAALPLSTGDAFPDAVKLIERFIVPFDCWSLADFGFFGAFNDPSSLVQVDNIAKGESLLKLLDKSIGTHEKCVAPHELSIALERIRQLSQKLPENRSFRRLEAVSRR